MELILNIITGICLCAACGFRVFVPLLILGIWHSYGWINLSSGSDWIGSTTALIIFGAAMVLEVGGYYNSWVDNMLDLITTPLALISGILLMSAVILEINPYLRWGIIVILGGGIAVNIQFLSVKARALSAFVVAKGWGNPVFATIELLSSVLISVMALTVPLLSLIFLLVIIYIIRRTVMIADRKRKLLIS